MGQFLRYAMPAVLLGAVLATGAQAAETLSLKPAALPGQAAQSQTANVPMGTIRLRIIPRIGGAALTQPIRWQVMTFGRDGNGQRQQVAEMTEATPELVLPAGWYVVRARLADQLIRHPVEVTAGKTFKYTLVKR